MLTLFSSFFFLAFQTVGHDWPSTNANDDNAAHNGPATFNASSLILGYFATHPLGWSFDS